MRWPTVSEVAVRLNTTTEEVMRACRCASFRPVRNRIPECYVSGFGKWLQERKERNA